MRWFNIDHTTFVPADGALALKYGSVFHGRGVDHRETQSALRTRNASNVSIPFYYDYNKRAFSINGDVVVESKLHAELRKLSLRGNVLIDATTLNPVELAALIKAILLYRKSSFYLVYYEPKSYTRKKEGGFRSFELSNRVNTFRGAPFFSYEIDADLHLAVFFLGYEGQRLDRAFEQLPLQPQNSRVCFGSPAFNFGWELDSFANNVGILADRKLSTETFYSGANAVADTFSMLCDIKKRTAVEKRMFVIPIGTKPHGVAAALFANQFDDVGIFYDFPEKRDGRSQDLGKGHLYHVVFK